MSYGASAWASTSTRARRATSASASKRKPVKKSKSKTVKRAAKPKKTAAKKRSVTSRAKSKKAPAKKRASASAKLYKVYDLQMGGRLVKVTKSDPRYLEEDDALEEGRLPRYVHRKPSAATKRTFATGELVGGSEVARSILGSAGARTAAAAALAPLAPKAIKLIPKIIKAAAGTVAATGSLEGVLGTGAVTLGASGLATLAAAGIGSYFATRYLIDNFPTKQRRLNAAADAYRKSRTTLAATLGRSLNSSELAALAAHYKSVVAEINKYPF